MNAQTLVQPVVERARQQPQQPALIFIHDDGQEETISAGQFHQEATAYAAALRQIGIRKGELVVLVLQHSRVLLSAFWGALYLGLCPPFFLFSRRSWTLRCTKSGCTR
jgi:acyl-CoA synthetase (AMP-forming)/AMP-acid ligase II